MARSITSIGRNTKVAFKNWVRHKPENQHVKWTLAQMSSAAHTRSVRSRLN